MKKLIAILFLATISFSNNISFINRNNNFRPNNIVKITKPKKKKIIIEKFKMDKDNEKKVLILKKAKKLMGKKYLWGAKVGDYNNFDCSSFVKALYKEIGVNLPRVSKDQSRKGEKIPLDQLEIGDLIFFHTLGDYVSHVGIYIGNNKFIHASSKAKKTIVSTLSGYYRKKAVFGTRLMI